MELALPTIPDGPIPTTFAMWSIKPITFSILQDSFKESVPPNDNSFPMLAISARTTDSFFERPVVDDKYLQGEQLQTTLKFWRLTESSSSNLNSRQWSRSPDLWSDHTHS